jgi:uncharacterized protein (DUF2147 family)
MRLSPLLAAVVLSSTAAAAATPMDGFWLTDDHKGVVHIGACGAHVCGWIVRVLDRGPNVPTRDVNNPNPALRGRPILGMPVMTGFTLEGGELTGGHAYDPKSGRSYRTTISLNPNRTLNVTGCVLFICQTMVWTRVR